MSEVIDGATGEVMTETALVVEREDAMDRFTDPVLGIAAAQNLAEQLQGIVNEKRLSVRIGQGNHLKVEGWCTLGALAGLSPRTEWTKECRNPVSGELEGYEARVEVIRLATGAIVGAAEAGCFSDEKQGSRQRWTERHAMKSMAQTRAVSKALGQCLRWIPVLAGYSGTPAEEMDGVKERARGRTAASRPSEHEQISLDEAPPAETRPAPLATSLADGEWLDERLSYGRRKFNGKDCADMTWREMIDGAKPGGGRHGFLTSQVDWFVEQSEDQENDEAQRASHKARLARIMAALDRIEGKVK